jgi:putative ubiquitin-RnfH superfamily antitoxin RatB of RatAB toxin-antitoxin module
MIVKVAPIGETVTEVNVESGTTVSEILDIAGILENGRSITVDNVPASLNTSVYTENAIISLANKMKGGGIYV